MKRRSMPRTAVPRLTHEQAVKHLVEYHFGRLSPSLTSAVETHIRDCARCQREGLRHAGTERRATARRFRKVRGGKPAFSARGKRSLLLLLLVLLVELVIVPIIRGDPVTVASLLGIRPGAGGPGGSAPALIAPRALPAETSGSVAVAISADGATVATAGAQDGQVRVALWRVADGTPVATLAWPGTTAPSVLTWSQDGKQLAGEDGTSLAVWSLPTPQPTRVVRLPAGSALVVYDTQSGSTSQQLPPGSAFAGGTFLRWGENGQVLPAPAGAAGATDVPAPGVPLVGLWQVAGSHLYASDGVRVGTAPTDKAGSSGLVAWSPDGRYLLWGSVSQPVNVGGSAPPEAIKPPNALVTLVAGNLARAKQGDALVWFAPSGRSVALCDRSSAQAALTVYDVATARATATLHGICPGLTTAALSWAPSSTTLALALPGRPVALYQLP